MSSNEWKSYKLGEIATFYNGRAYKNEEFKSFGTPIVRIQNLTGEGKTVYSDLELDANKYIEAGDLIYAWSATFGPYIWKGPRSIYHYHIWKIECNDQLLDKQYLYYKLKVISDSLQDRGNGTLFVHITKAFIESFEISIPPIETQRRVANILSTLDEKIELNRQTNATLEAIAQSIFREWFVEFNYPDPKGLSREQAPSEAMESGVNGSRQAGQTFRVSDMVESELGMIPQGWRVGKLGDVVEVKGGTTPSTKEEKYWNGEYYFATPKDLSNLGSPILLDTERKITKEGVSQISSGILPKGTLLLSSRAPIGYLAISNIPVSINQGFIAINAKETSNLFILHWLKENMETVISRANGSTFLEITKTNFKQIEIVIPDSEITNRFEEIVSPIFEKIKNNEQQSATLASLRDALLPKLMSGEIEV